MAGRRVHNPFDCRPVGNDAPDCRLLDDYKAKSNRINVAGFKDLTQVSGKYAIPLLKYLDREQATRRSGDERISL